MKKTATILLVSMLVLIVAPAAFAQEGGGAAAPTNWVAFAKALAMGIAAAACGTAQARATAAACKSYARNPGAAGSIQFALLLALVLIESMALYVFASFFIKIT
jgi:F-type H+-transporting ATPase subunit c